MSNAFFSCSCLLAPAGGLPGRPSKCSLAWQRGAKLQYTAAAFVDGQEHVVYWDETLKQVRGSTLRERFLSGLPLGHAMLRFNLFNECCACPCEAEGGLHGRQLDDFPDVFRHASRRACESAFVRQ